MPPLLLPLGWSDVHYMDLHALLCPPCSALCREALLALLAPKGKH